MIEAVKQKAARSDIHIHVLVPLNRPRYGNVVQLDAQHDAAKLRLDLALAFLKEEDIDASGEVGDPDPFNAVTDTIATRKVDEIIVSTLPATSSGWLRRDLIDRLRDETGLPVEHVVVDIDSEPLPADITVVAANLTVADEELIQHLKAKAVGDRPRRFIVVVPQDAENGVAVRAARERLSTLLASLAGAGLVAAGTIGDPDPYTAIMNTLQFFRANDVVISTLPENTSKWLRTNVIERVRSAGAVPVEHVVSTPKATSTQ